MLPGRTPALLLALVAFVACLVPMEDADFWWHLRGAQEVLRQGSWRLTDNASFLQPDTLWLDTEWLFQVPLAGLWALGGAPAVTVAIAALAGITAYVSARTWAVPAAALVQIAIVDHWAERPQSLMLLALVLLLRRGEGTAPTGRGLVVLAIAQLLWSHTHASHVLMPALLAVFAIDRGLSGAREDAKRWAVAAVECGGIALLLNPLGPGVVGEILDHARTDSAAHIGDMRPPGWADLWPAAWDAQAARLLVGVLAIAALFGRRDAGWWRAVLSFGLGLLLAGTAVRFFPAAAVLAMPLAARLFVDAPTWWRLPALLVMPLTLALQAPRIGVLGVRELHLPVDAVRFLAHGQGRLFNQYDDGGYLSWSLQGRWQIAIDGRTPTFFTAPNHALWRQAQRSMGTFSHLVQAHSIDAALVRRDRPICRKLRDSEDWRVAYLDVERALFLPRAHPLAAGLDLQALPACDDQPPEADCAYAEAQRSEAAILDRLTPDAFYPALVRMRLSGCPGADTVEAGAVAASLLADDAGPDWFAAAEALARAGDPDAAIEWARRGARRFSDGNYSLLAATIADGSGRPSIADWDDAARRLDDGMLTSVRAKYARRLADAGREDEARLQALRAAWGGDDNALELLKTLGPPVDGPGLPP